MTVARTSIYHLLQQFLKQEAALGNYSSLFVTQLPPAPGQPMQCASREPKPSSASSSKKVSGVGFRVSGKGSGKVSGLGSRVSEGDSVLPDVAELSPPPPSSARPATAGSPLRLRDKAVEKYAAPSSREPREFTPPDGDKTAQLAALRAFIGDCQLCPALVKNRRKIVFGAGNPDADIMFVGEAPGRDEDIQGVPFVGRAGQLLMDIIEKGMKLRREDVYIANILKCRPPENRDPEPGEEKACTAFLNWQLAIVKPRVIVALGLHSAQYLTGSNRPLRELRGSFHDYRGIPVMSTYHPAYLCRYYTRENRLKVWDDIKKVMDFLETA